LVLVVAVVRIIHQPEDLMAATAHFLPLHLMVAAVVVLDLPIVQVAQMVLLVDLAVVAQPTMVVEFKELVVQVIHLQLAQAKEIMVAQVCQIIGQVVAVVEQVLLVVMQIQAPRLEETVVMVPYQQSLAHQ
jgi:hypothetical protein